MLKKINITFVIFVLLTTIILVFLPTGFENPKLYKNCLSLKAVVTDTDNSNIQVLGLIKTGTQLLNTKIISGKFEDEEINSENPLIGQLSTDNIYSVGDKILLRVNTDKSGNKILNSRAENHYRIGIEYILLILFASFLILFAKWTGFKALISFVFTALVIWKILLPSILNGYSPIITGFVVVCITSACIILLITGFSKKGAVALSGSVIGVGITTILAISFGHWFKIPGTVADFSDALLYAGFTNLNLTDIFISCIYISAAGAVMDVAMDVAASQGEVYEKMRDISSRELIKSGFNVAKPVIGTMTTTLLFAYSGGFMFMFMLFMAKGTPMYNILNMNYIAAEILHTLVGSFGLVLVAPITAVIGGYLYTNKFTNI